MDEVHAAAGGHPDMDYAEHDRTYHFFLSLIKWGGAGVILVIMFLALLWG
jgi:hypothetical protein